VLLSRRLLLRSNKLYKINTSQTCCHKLVETPKPLWHKNKKMIPSSAPPDDDGSSHPFFNQPSSPTRLKRVTSSDHVYNGLSQDSTQQGDTWKQLEREGALFFLNTFFKTVHELNSNGKSRQAEELISKFKSRMSEDTLIRFFHSYCRKYTGGEIAQMYDRHADAFETMDKSCDDIGLFQGNNVAAADSASNASDLQEEDENSGDEDESDEEKNIDPLDKKKALLNKKLKEWRHQLKKITHSQLKLSELVQQFQKRDGIAYTNFKKLFDVNSSELSRDKKRYIEFYKEYPRLFYFLRTSVIHRHIKAIKKVLEETPRWKERMKNLPSRFPANFEDLKEFEKMATQ